MESGLQLKESGIPLKIGIQNLSSSAKTGIRYLGLESAAWNLEFQIVLDSFPYGDLRHCITSPDLSGFQLGLVFQNYTSFSGPLLKSYVYIIADSFSIRHGKTLVWYEQKHPRFRTSLPHTSSIMEAVGREGFFN